jgi:protein ImuA
MAQDMTQPKSDIIQKLEKEILHLQGYRSVVGDTGKKLTIGSINDAFPNAQFPTGAIHEFIATEPENRAVVSGFITTLLSSLMSDGGIVLWISSSRTIFPPALKFFNIDPHKVVFIDLHNQKDVAWAVEEALKLNGLAGVVGEMDGINFTTSRRLQLAVEKSQVTGFIMNGNKNNINRSNACLTRWKITSLPGLAIDDLPGIGYPAWKVELLKVRNGRPGSWEIAWMNGQLISIVNEPMVLHDLQRKTG